MRRLMLLRWFGQLGDLRRAVALGAVSFLIVAPSALALAGFVRGPALVVIILLAALIGLSLSLLLLVLLQVDWLRRTLYSQIAVQVGGLPALWPVPIDQPPYLPFGGSALSPAAASRLAQLARSDSIAQIVEFGSGASTVLLARLQADRPSPAHVISVEHDGDFARIVQQALEGTRHDTTVSIVTVPLAPTPYGEWYSAEWEKLLPTEIDLVVVDGPIDVAGTGARTPAYQTVVDHLRDGATILVDDTDRPAERRMVDQWLQTDSRLGIVLRGKDHTVLRFRAHAEHESAAS